MLARLMGRHLWSVSLLVGLGLLTVTCVASTPGRGVTSPALTPAPSSTATMTMAPTTRATLISIAGCSAPVFENPPGPLPTTMPLPSGTLVGARGLGIQAGSVNYTFCTPTMTPAAITAYMDSALPAAGWMKNSIPACDHAHGYPWYKGSYGIEVDVGLNATQPDMWSIQLCPHVGQD